MARNTTNAWGLPDAKHERATALADKAHDEVRVADFLLFATLAARQVVIGGFPLNELAMILAVVLAAGRPRPRDGQVPGWVVPILAAMVLLLTYSGMANHLDWTRRVGHLVIWSSVIYMLASGQISRRSAALGLGSGLVVVGGLAVVKVGGDWYPGRLTGYLGDPNAGAYFIVVLGALAVGFATLRSKQLRLLMLVALVAIMYLTLSRTAMLATGFGLLWWAFGRRLGSVGGVAAVWGLTWIVNNIPKSITNWGPFADREGSDALRQRIIKLEHIELSTSPWYGHGPSTAVVHIGPDQYFFHNSFYAVRQEGGWLLLILVMTLMILVFLRLSPFARAGDRQAIACQASLIATVVMATTLGEVFLEMPLAIALGFGLRTAAQLRGENQQPDVALPYAWRQHG